MSHTEGRRGKLLGSAPVRLGGRVCSRRLVHGPRAGGPDPAGDRSRPARVAEPRRAAVHELLRVHRLLDARLERCRQPHRRQAHPPRRPGRSSSSSAPSPARRTALARSSVLRAGWGLGNALFIATALSVIVGSASGGVAGAVMLYEAALGFGISLGPLLGGELGGISLARSVLRRRRADGDRLHRDPAVPAKTPPPPPESSVSVARAAARRCAIARPAAAAWPRCFYNFGFFTLLGLHAVSASPRGPRARLHVHRLGPDARGLCGVRRSARSAAALATCADWAATLAGIVVVLLVMGCAARLADRADRRASSSPARSSASPTR